MVYCSCKVKGQIRNKAKSYNLAVVVLLFVSGP